jgi:cell volume regulation protein A
MTASIVISLCILVLIAYLFDISASKTKIPSVILLLILGFVAKVLTNFMGLHLPDLNPIVPVLGTIGLILIVLEGSLELEINRQKLPLILKSSLIALLPLILISFAIAYYLYYVEAVPLKLALSNAIPLCIISSAIAIPSAKNLPSHQREFVTYESSLSDIFGVVFFNFITLNDNIGTQTFGRFSLELMVMLVISFVATLLLAGFLNKIKHHIKFIPMIVILVLIYFISKLFHLPALIFILIFGLFIANIDELRNFSLVNKFHPIQFSKDVHKFREITTELAFLVRALFFILFGYLIEVSDVFNKNTLLLAIGITAFIFILRYGVLRLVKLPANPLTYIAPRGLITILLFLSVPMEQQIPFINKSLITQIIVLTALVMMYGLIKYKKPLEEKGEEMTE